MKEIKNESNYQDEFFERNFSAVKDNFSLSFLIIKRWNIFSYVAQLEMIHFIRNFFCEKVAFYILWLVSYIRFLFILAIFSIGVHFILQNENKFKSIIVFSINGLYDKDVSLEFHTLDLIYLIFSVIVGVWSTLFFNYWENSEVYYSHLWGTTNVESTEPYRKEFKHDKFNEFIFEKKIPSQRKWVQRLKQLVSSCIICLMGYITILIVNGLLSLNPDNYGPKNSTIGNLTDENNTTLNETISNITSVFIQQFSNRYLQAGKSTLTFNNSTIDGNSTNMGNQTGKNGTEDIDDILRNTDLKSFLQNPWPVLIGIFNGIQIEFMSWGYAKLAVLLNDWENHEKESDYENNYILKIMIFEFVNNFNSLFTIAFVKVIILFF